MTVKELREQLEKIPDDAIVHLSIEESNQTELDGVVLSAWKSANKELRCILTTDVSLFLIHRGMYS